MSTESNKAVFIAVLHALVGCSPALNRVTVTCPTSRTLLDGVCVAEGVADYVGCVRAQGAQLDASKRERLAADIGYFQAKVGGSAELDENLQRKYSASDQAVLEIIRVCTAFVGATAPDSAQPPASSTPQVRPDAAVHPTAPAARPPPPPPSGSLIGSDHSDSLPNPGAISATEREQLAKRLFREATAAYNQNDFFNAIIKFEQAYAYAPERDILAYDIALSAWELRDCARVQSYARWFIASDTTFEDLRAHARELLRSAENSAECITHATHAASP